MEWMTIYDIGQPHSIILGDIIFVIICLILGFWVFMKGSGVSMNW